MQIVSLVNTSDQGGGAEKVACQLTQGLVQRGIETTLWVGTQRSNAPWVRELPMLPGERSLALRIGWHLGLQDLVLPSSFRWAFSQAVRTANAVHLHNLHSGYLSPLSLPLLSRRTQLFWTLHDCWSFTGKCIYPLDCQGWLNGCGHCPQLGQYPAMSRDGTATLLRLKEAIYRRSRLTIIVPSRWMGQQVERTALSRFPIHHISNGVDTDIFRPLPKAEARSRLGLPMERKLILFLAGQLHDRRKGMRYLLEALNEMDRADVELLIVGNQVDELRLPVRHPVHRLSYTSDETRLALCYAAADLFVSPALADNCPLTILEAMASGTPIVAFNVGGVGEEIEDGQTGLLVPAADTAMLAGAINRLLDDNDLREQMAKAGRERAERNFGLDLFIERHLRLYAEVVGL